jgi:hypothetical protein
MYSIKNVLSWQGPAWCEAFSIPDSTYRMKGLYMKLEISTFNMEYLITSSFSLSPFFLTNFFSVCELN